MAGAPYGRMPNFDSPGIRSGPARLAKSHSSRRVSRGSTISSMAANAVRLQLHALAYNLANFMRTLALPDEVESWSLTTIREKLGKIGARGVAHARYVVFQMAEVTVPKDLFRRIVGMIDDLRPREPMLC